MVPAKLQSEVGELVAGKMLSCLLTRPEFGHVVDIELYIALVASVLSLFSLGVEIAPVQFLLSHVHPPLAYKSSSYRIPGPFI